MDLVERAGLEGVVAARTRLSHVDGQKGELVIAGYPVEEIAGRASFEEGLFLLWKDRRPTDDELHALRSELASHRALDGAVVDLIRRAADARAPAMAALRMGAAALDLGGEKGDQAEAIRAIAALPVVLATYVRRREALPEIETGSQAETVLALLGLPVSAARIKALDTYLVTVCDHGLNASTFAARVVASTGASMTDALVAAMGALSGPLHGGAPGPALETVFEVGDPSRAETVLRSKLARGERLMGFGHRVYKVRDPRADVLGRAAQELFAEGDGDPALYALAREVERTAVRLLEEHKPGRNLQTNVEFYTALLLHGLGLDAPLFTPTFAISRVSGWIAHAMEQRRANRIIRPQSEYAGPRDRRWVPPAARIDANEPIGRASTS
jgi:citrate synthase